MITFWSRSRALKMISVALGLALSIVVFAGVSVSAPSLVPITQWSTAVPLPESLLPAAVALSRPAENYVYVVGGKNAADQPVRNVRRATIQPNGSIGAWINEAALPVGLYNHALVASSDGNYLFVIGGWDGTTRRRDVWRATVNTNGSVGSWTKVSDYPIAVATHDAAVAGNRIYVVGGTGIAGNLLRTIYFTTIQSDGALGPWTPARDLPKTLFRHAVAAHNGFLYVTGGDDGTGAQSTIYFARINPDGSLAAWQTASLPARRLYHRALIQDNRLVILGGSTDNVNGQNTVHRALINANGSLGTWEAQQPMPKALFRHGAAVAFKNGFGYVFVLGGLQGANSQNTVYYSNVPKPLRYLPIVARQATATRTPTPRPTNTPTVRPTNTPTVRPTNTPTVRPTNTPTVRPTNTPTVRPTDTPTIRPTDTPTGRPTDTPTPTYTPTRTPTISPNLTPTPTRTPSPTFTSTATPTPRTCIRSIQGTVFEDLNGDGNFQPPEPRLSGVMLSLQGPSGSPTTHTNSSGTYGFLNLTAGDYQVTETDPSGYQSLPNSPNTRNVTIVQCPTGPAYQDFGDVRIPTATPTNTPIQTSTPTPTSTTAPVLSISINNVASASSVNVGDQYSYGVTVMNTSVSASLTRIVLNDQYNQDPHQCVVAVSASNAACTINQTLPQWDCDIETGLIPNSSITVRFIYEAVDKCTSTQNANTATAVGYQGTSSSAPVSDSAYVTIN